MLQKPVKSLSGNIVLFLTEVSLLVDIEVKILIFVMDSANNETCLHVHCRYLY